MKVNIRIISGLIALLWSFTGCKKEEIVLNREQLHAQAVEESLHPIQPGIPGKAPFWNVHASRFIWAPAFEFKELPGIRKYKFTLTGKGGNESFSFFADKPWHALTPVWKHLPVGYYKLEVSGLDNEDRAVELAGTREFYRSAAFNGPYNKPARDYRLCAKMDLEYLFNTSWFQHWLTYGKPDPSYSLYCYPSKMIPAVINGMLLYARLVPGHEKSARNIALNAARYLIGVSEPADAPLAYFPPTYDGRHIDTTRSYPNDIDMPWAAKMSKKNEGLIMMIYPARVVPAYLKLFDEMRDSIYFKAAYGIVSTYARVQLPDGRWPLLLDRKSGKATVKNFANTGVILDAFILLKDQYGINDFDEVIAKAEKVWADPYENFDFEGQFEDVPPSERYRNLANYPALQAARHFFERAGTDSITINKAKTFLNFAEDQFVVWEKPIPKPRPDREEYSKGWIIPAALEQYECYRPIDAHAAAFISVYWLAYRQTGEKIYLAKAISLANSMTRAQDPRSGRIPTWWLPAWIKAPGWLNCAVKDAEVMNEFGENISRLNIKY